MREMGKKMGGEWMANGVPAGDSHPPLPTLSPTPTSGSVSARAGKGMGTLPFLNPVRSASILRFATFGLVCWGLPPFA